jgi:hypothetical protein
VPMRLSPLACAQVDSFCELLHNIFEALDEE